MAVMYENQVPGDPQLRAALWRGFDDAVSGRVTDLDDVLKVLDLEDV